MDERYRPAANRWQRRTYHARKEQGLCVRRSCGKPASHGVFCAECRDYNSRAVKRCRAQF